MTNSRHPLIEAGSDACQQAHGSAHGVMLHALSRQRQDAIGDAIRMCHPGPRTIASGIVRTPVLSLWCLDDREHFRGRVIPQPRPCFMDIRQQTRRCTRQHPWLDVDDVAVQVVPAIQIAGIMLVLMARETMHYNIPISAACLQRRACPLLWRARACLQPCAAPFLGFRALPRLLLGKARVTCRWCASHYNRHTDKLTVCLDVISLVVSSWGYDRCQIEQRTVSLQLAVNSHRLKTG